MKRTPRPAGGGFTFQFAHHAHIIIWLFCPVSIHWSITGRFTEPVTRNIVLMCLLAISASNTICMHCIHIVLLAEIASKHINTIVLVTGSVNLPVMLQCGGRTFGFGWSRDQQAPPVTLLRRCRVTAVCRAQHLPSTCPVSRPQCVASCEELVSEEPGLLPALL